MQKDQEKTVNRGTAFDLSVDRLRQLLNGDLERQYIVTCAVDIEVMARSPKEAISEVMKGLKECNPTSRVRPIDCVCEDDDDCVCEDDDDEDDDSDYTMTVVGDDRP